MAKWPISGLRVRLVLLVLLAGLPIVVLWGISALQLRQHAQQEAQTLTLQAARSAVREYNALVDGARQLLPALAAAQEVVSLEADDCGREFAALLVEYPRYANLGAMGTDGLIFCSGLPFTPPIDSSDSSFFRQAVASGGFAIGEFQIGRITGIPTVNFGYPAVDEDGAIVAVVFAALDLAWVNEVAVSFDLPPGSTLTVFDHNGTILARDPSPLQWVGQTVPETDIVEAAIHASGETTLQAVGLDGVERVYSMLPIGHEQAPADVNLAVAIPVDVFYAPVMAVERQLLLGVLVATALAATATWFFGDRLILKRVEALVRAARAIGEGRLASRVGEGQGGDELGNLAAEFDAMAEQLERREQALEEAAAELRRVNRALVMLSACNQVLIRAIDTNAMAQQICETIVAHGGFRLAWVGLAESESLPNLRVVGRAGAAVAYLDETAGGVGDGASPDGPEVAAIRTGAPAIVRDIWTADVGPAWRRLASKHGFASAIGLPLRRGERTIGALSLYAGQPEAFDAEELGLLSELADDFSFGLEALRRDAERQRAQADVVRLEDFHRGIVENVAEGITLYDAAGHVIFANSAADGLLGYGPGELLGRHWMDLIHVEEHEVAEQRRAARSRGEVDRFEATLIRKDGQTLQARVSATTLYEDGVPSGSLLVFNDVTAEREYQRRAELQERLGAVGQLAAGIAHDFNNIVGAIILLGEMLLAEPGFSAAARDRVRLIVEQAHRGAELTQQILDFGRKSIVERRPTDLLLFLREFVRLVARTLPEPIEVQIKGSETEYTISADPGRLQQALLNLTLNARDAMRQGGVITFHLSRLEVRPGAPPYRDMSAGSWIQLSVSDTGSGIPPEVLRHIFEPFYTTKPIGEGTGLGLSQVYGIVKQLDGYIDVQSAPGQGTTFLLYFPVLAAPPSSSPAEEPAADFQGNGETILIVEDDEAARNALGETLVRMNYNILLAEDGARALEIFAASERIALVISDVVMPRIGGIELFRELRKINPDVRALLVTGYPVGKDTRELLEAGKAGWIQKPFDSRTLGSRIRLMLRP